MKKTEIRVMDHTGDTCIADFDPAVAESVTVAAEAFDKFMSECIATHGEAPTVFARRTDAVELTPFDLASDDLRQMEQVVIHQPLIGG